MNDLVTILSLPGSTAGWNLDKKKSCFNDIFYSDGSLRVRQASCYIKWGFFRRCAMDFNVKRLAADAGTFLSRAVQVSLNVYLMEIVASPG